ncbi:proteinase-activated receptor 1 isoform X2 [Tympanuchus pallidicinctus]|uniref:proteinase-activated receptor 1 isoform X2 n=1 Tax=Tympanuchus pallidicinctus TaxID=109042 RepID=UPI002286E7F7|nr:proteinase-activated receptor 1 isoform X2 [Tympanuchus pallidicinctus]
MRRSSGIQMPESSGCAAGEVIEDKEWFTSIPRLRGCRAVADHAYNNSSVRGRTFLIPDRGEPIPVEDIENSAENDSEVGLGSTNQSRSPPHEQRTVSVETAGYLTSPWLTRFVPSVYTLVVVLSLPLNITAIFVFLKKMKIEKPAVVYMLNLALADVLFVSVLPFKIAYHFSGNNWVFGPRMCRFVTAAFYCNMYCSVMLMTSISFDRFLAVVYPMQALGWRTLTRASVICFIIWFVAITGVVPFLIREQTMEIPKLNITTCHDVLRESELHGYYVHFFSVFSSVFFVVPFIISTICYVCIIRCLSSSSIVARQNKKTRALLLCVAVFSVFVICFGPTNVLLLIHYIHFSYNNSLEYLYFAYLLCVCISSVSCCIDPFIYYYASSQYQRQLFSLLSCKETLDPNSSNSSGQSMSTTSRRGTCSTNANNSVYSKLLVIQ